LASAVFLAGVPFVIMKRKRDGEKSAADRNDEPTQPVTKSLHPANRDEDSDSATDSDGGGSTSGSDSASESDDLSSIGGDSSSSSSDEDGEFVSHLRKSAHPTIGRVLPVGTPLWHGSRSCIKPNAQLDGFANRCPRCLIFVDMKLEYWSRATCRIPDHASCDGKQWVCCLNCSRKKALSNSTRVRQNPSWYRSSFFSKMLSAAKSSAATRRAKGRAAAGIITLVSGDLERMWGYQQGKCFYSGLPLQFHRSRNWFVSLERLDPTQGYVLGNVALVAREFNGSSQITRHKLSAMLVLPHQPLDPLWLAREIEKASQSRKEGSRVAALGANGTM
jgi:hypothetical protein